MKKRSCISVVGGRQLLIHQSCVISASLDYLLQSDFYDIYIDSFVGRHRHTTASKIHSDRWSRGRNEISFNNEMSKIVKHIFPPNELFCGNSINFASKGLQSIIQTKVLYSLMTATERSYDLPQCWKSLDNPATYLDQSAGFCCASLHSSIYFARSVHLVFATSRYQTWKNSCTLVNFRFLQTLSSWLPLSLSYRLYVPSRVFQSFLSHLPHWQPDLFRFYQILSSQDISATAHSFVSHCRLLQPPSIFKVPKCNAYDIVPYLSNSLFSAPRPQLVYPLFHMPWGCMDLHANLCHLSSISSADCEFTNSSDTSMSPLVNQAVYHVNGISKNTENSDLLNSTETSNSKNNNTTSTDYNSSHDDDQNHSPPTKQQLRRVLITSCIPFIGFGFVDNFCMILFGDGVSGN